MIRDHFTRSTLVFSHCKHLKQQNKRGDHDWATIPYRENISTNVQIFLRNTKSFYVFFVADKNMIQKYKRKIERQLWDEDKMGQAIEEVHRGLAYNCGQKRWCSNDEFEETL